MSREKKEKYGKCHECHEKILISKLFETVNGDLVCADCVEEKFEICSDCQKYDLKDNMSQIHNGDYVCEYCSEYYSSCNECGDLFHENDTHCIENEGITVCD